jgi:hypothetical protein
MTACANCARELRPEWKFCVSCGMPTGVTSARPETRSIPIISMAPVAEPVPAPPPVAEPAPARLPEPEPTPVPQPVVAIPTPPAARAVEASAAPATIGISVLAPTLEVTAPATGAVSVVPSRSTSSTRPRRRRVNALAVVALVLGCLASPLAALFGHLALGQIHASGERGRIAAIAAIVLGYGSLAFIVGLGVIYLATHA